MSTIAAGHGFDLAVPRRSARANRQGAARPSGARSVRLTRRGRLVLLGLFAVVAFVVTTMLGGESAATGESGAPVQTRTVMVGQGDTLWEIAAEVAEPGEVREMIHHIQELNALSDVSLRQGQELAVPVG